MSADRHIGVLDGWRGASILLVLSAHLLPVGPKPWHLNAACGVLGMVLFFTLSGFLITSFLLRDPLLLDFLARRIFRIVPLAWLYLAIALALSMAPLQSWIAHFLFFANLPPKQLGPLTDHFWSVCIEMQFYVGVAILFAAAGTRGLLALPALCLLFTALRVFHGAYASTVTYLRFDEILAGCTLAIACHGPRKDALARIAARIPQWPLVPLLVLSCMEQGGWLNYARPYIACTLVGLTVLNPGTSLADWLRGRTLGYLAAVSYALYVIHPLLMASWLGSGDLLEKYAKRPLLFVVLLALAHLSTYHFESRWIAFGRRLAARAYGLRNGAAPPGKPARSEK